MSANPNGRAAKPRLLLSRRLPDAVEARAARDYDAIPNREDVALDGAALAARAAGCDGILVTAGDRLDSAAVAALPESVRILATFSVGTDHIDLAAARARGIRVTNTPDVLTEATAEIALLLMLGAARRAHEGERLIRERAWTGWTPTQLLGVQLTGKRLAVLGMGRIGQAVAHRARAFGMEIHYSNRRRLPPAEEQGAVFHAEAEAMLPLADFLTIHFPLTPETRHWLDARRIALLPDGAIVVNTARGPVIEDAALIAALRSGKLAAAGLDVFTGEPALDPAYPTLPNTFLLPHLGSATIETRNAMGFRALDNLDAFFRGQEPPDAVA
ncbi:2-hydroxyacid dehydrogenase [Arenibaculum pallidiluteum]|uniref:2-hydroxyacid dehydrogenase n=1 Tax=Arenibaculum pallidiluteum TaxID=2812559 RepID=UPI001A957F3E|nr:D-glycerate dehydrogenase [Arenibaculum pallidiluteum]